MQMIDYPFCVWVEDRDERDTLLSNILSPKINWSNESKELLPRFKPPVVSFGVCAQPNGEGYLVFGWYETRGYMTDCCGEELSVGEFLRLIADFNPDVSALTSLMEM